MTVRIRTATIAIAMLLVGLAATAEAQDRPAPVIEVIAGHAGFVDDVWDHFLLLGAGARAYVTPRLAIGGEVAHMGNATTSSHLTVTGNVTFDLRRDDGARNVVPYAVIAGGFVRQRSIVGSGPGSTELQPFTSSEGHISGGIGARIGLGSRVYIAPEVRIGWEPNTRMTVALGFKL